MKVNWEDVWENEKNVKQITNVCCLSERILTLSKCYMANCNNNNRKGKMFIKS